jgi:hypothetical protein
MGADIHDGQEHKRSVQGPDTEAQDLSPPNHHFPLATRLPRGDIGAPCYGVSIPCRAMICRDRSPRQMKAVGA